MIQNTNPLQELLSIPNQINKDFKAKLHWEVYHCPKVLSREEDAGSSLTGEFSPIQPSQLASVCERISTVSLQATGQALSVGQGIHCYLPHLSPEAPSTGSEPSCPVANRLSNIEREVGNMEQDALTDTVFTPMQTVCDKATIASTFPINV